MHHGDASNSAPKLKPTSESLDKYNKEFYGILGQLTSVPFYTEQKAEGKRFPALKADDASLSDEQREHAKALEGRVKIGTPKDARERETRRTRFSR